MGSDNPQIHLGRPSKAPATIFNHALANLQQRLEHLEQIQPSRPEIERAVKYLQCAVAFYHRELAMKNALEEAVGEKGGWNQT